MTSCKVCKKSEVSMLCICEECFKSLESGFELYDKDRRIRNLKEEKDIINERFFDIVKEKDELKALNRELAERRTPKKVKEHYNWCDFTEEEKLENHHWFCENCTAPVEEHHNYCSECGQKLDWRVE